MRKLLVALAQINVTVGDLEGNTQKIIEGIRRAREVGADLVAFPEQAVPGYPAEDLLLKPSFIKANRQCLDRIVAECRGMTAIVGFADSDGDIYNAAAIIHDGTLRGIYHKWYLPNYGVFDENRYFQAGVGTPVFVVNGIAMGVSICEDIWYPSGPAENQAMTGDAEILINISASPYHAGKGKIRARMLATRAYDTVAIVVFNNLVGGQDELIFDGNSMIFNERGELVARGKAFEEDFVVADLDADAVFRHRLHDPRRRKEKYALQLQGRQVERVVLSEKEAARSKPALEPRPLEPPLDPIDEIYQALVLGTRDYVRKNGFEKVVIGLSGGIDSSLTAAIAVDALGKSNVVGVAMPTRYSTQEGLEDAEGLAKNLGVRYMVIPIDSVFQSYLDTLKEPFAGQKPDVTEENIQARIRGTLLMALSNKFGWLVLTTGNKSEVSVGYCTLYGDTAGGFNVLKDIPKTLVYKLAERKNQRDGREVIPPRVLTKPPSAELRPNQTDQDTLPPYEILDPILQAYVEEDKSTQEILASGDFDPQVLRRVISMVDSNEYKRRQAPPGIKITPRAFGKDRRLPITNRFREISSYIETSERCGDQSNPCT